jgi:branched-chain amino acid transport system substrate-binding protein
VLLAAVACTPAAAPAPTTPPTSASSAPTVSSAAAPAPAAAGAPLKAGASLCLSGAAGQLGQRMREGLELAQDTLSAQLPLQVVFEDSRADPQVGVSVFNKLASVDGVPIVFTCGTSVLQATTTLAEDKKVLMLNTSASGPSLVGASPWLFNDYVMTTEQARVMANYMRDTLGYKRLALVVRNDDYGRGTEKVFAPLWQQMGGEVVGSVYHDLGTQDHNSEVAKIRELGNVDAVYLMTAGKDAATFVKQARDQGLDTPFVGLDGVEDQQVIDLAGSGADNIVYTAAYADLQSQDPVTKTFMDAFRAKFGAASPHPFTVSYYDGALVWVELARYIQQHNLPYSGESLRSALLEIKRFPSLGGSETVFRDDGSAAKAVAIKKISGGKFTMVQVVKPS